jgi:hypothetical protein
VANSNTADRVAELSEALASYTFSRPSHYPF